MLLLSRKNAESLNDFLLFSSEINGIVERFVEKIENLNGFDFTARTQMFSCTRYQGIY